MAFHDSAIFPLEVQRLKASPGWQTTIVKLGGGAEQRNALFADSLRTYDAALGVKTLVNYQTLEKHFNARRGRLHGFLVLDRSNYIATTESFGTGNGVTAAFQLTKNDGDASNAYNREIYKPKSGTIQIFVNAVLKTETTHYTINYTTGIVTFTGGNIPTAGQSLTWSGQFYVPVRYDVDSLPDYDLFLVREDGTGLVECSVPLIEIRDIS